MQLHFRENMEVVNAYHKGGTAAAAAVRKEQHGKLHPPAAPDSGPPPVPDAVAEAARLRKHITSTTEVEYGADGLALRSAMSQSDDCNPHHPNNRCHAYEFVEVLLRCSARYCTEKHLKRTVSAARL